MRTFLAALGLGLAAVPGVFVHSVLNLEHAFLLYYYIQYRSLARFGLHMIGRFGITADRDGDATMSKLSSCSTNCACGTERKRVAGAVCRGVLVIVDFLFYRFQYLHGSGVYVSTNTTYNQ